MVNFNKAPKRGTSYVKFSRDRVNFKKMDKKTESKPAANNLAWKNPYLKQLWGNSLYYNAHHPWEKCGNNTYILDHKLLAWKCNRCGQYKQEDRKTTLDWLRKMKFEIDDEEYGKALNSKIP